MRSTAPLPPSSRICVRAGMGGRRLTMRATGGTAVPAVAGGGVTATESSIRWRWAFLRASLIKLMIAEDERDDGERSQLG